jgi:hypothetical protein
VSFPQSLTHDELSFFNDLHPPVSVFDVSPIPIGEMPRLTT